MRKLKRKSGAFEEVKKEPVKKYKRVKYKKARCSHIFENGERCKRFASGSSDKCITHGGSVFAPETLPASSFNAIVENGRYNPIEHPMLYLQLARSGMSDVEIAAQFQVSVAAIRGWAEQYKEFGIAYEIGQAMHEAWYLRVGKGGLNNRFFNTSLYKFLTGNKLGYSEKIETKNLNQNQYGVLLVPAGMTVDDWEQKNIEDEKKLKEVHTTKIDESEDIIDV